MKCYIHAYTSSFKRAINQVSDNYILERLFHSHKGPTSYGLLRKGMLLRYNGGGRGDRTRFQLRKSRL